jgi:hypothetical protein
MTARDGFDLFVASWLERNGPVEPDPAVIERALGVSARVRQRRGIMAALVGASSWPRARAGSVDVPVAARLLVLIGLLALTVAAVAIVASQRRDDRPSELPIGTLTSVGEPTVARNGAALVRLVDGRVAVAGGVEIGPAPLEVFDPAGGVFAAQSALDLPGTGSGFVLPTGDVLFVMFDGNNVRAYAEVLNPDTGAVLALPATATLHLDRPAAVQLADGRILLAGGNARQAETPPFSVPLAAAEIFDPATNRSARTGSMHITRFGHSAALLPDGRVLVSGGDGRSDAEVFDPRTGTFSDPIAMPTVRAETISVALPNGTVAVFRGGLTVLNPARPATGTPVDVFDPISNAFRAGAPVPFEPDTATALADGRVFLTTFGGGFVYDPASGVSRPTVVGPIGSGSVVGLADGGLLLIEGNGTDEQGRPMPAAAAVFHP